MADQLDTMPYWPRIDTGVGGIALARLHWLIKRTNADPNNELHYEVYQPFKSYDGLVFLKSMGPKASALAQRYIGRKKPVIFDANVNYYTKNGMEHYCGMFPTSAQTRDAIEITRLATVVVGDSRIIAGQCEKYNKNVCWIPDNVEVDLIPREVKRNSVGKPLIIWSGDALKLYELLKIENTLLQFAGRYSLVVVTSGLSAMRYWKAGYKERVQNLLQAVGADVRQYQTLRELLSLYRVADVVLAPRFLDNDYNLGHTEWKITLGMACGCIAIVSPVPSYLDVQNRAPDGAMVLCDTQAEWVAAFHDITTDRLEDSRREAARDVVEKYYSSRVVAKQYENCLMKIL